MRRDKPALWEVIWTLCSYRIHRIAHIPYKRNVLLKFIKPITRSSTVSLMRLLQK